MLQKRHNVLKQRPQCQHTLEEEPKYFKSLLVNHSWLQKGSVCSFRFKLLVLSDKQQGMEKKTQFWEPVLKIKSQKWSQLETGN